MKFTDRLRGEHQGWMRRPDHADSFSLADMARWFNERPTNVFPKAADIIDELEAALRMVMQHGRIDNSEARMNRVGSALAKLEKLNRE